MHGLPIVGVVKTPASVIRTAPERAPVLTAGQPFDDQFRRCWRAATDQVAESIVDTRIAPVPCGNAAHAT